MASTSKHALELRGIQKAYGAVQALRDAELVVKAGTVHALVGENGAGKSTLMKIAFGMVRADAGAIALKGQEVPLAAHGPARSLASGVGMVHQHFMLIDSLTVVENTVLGREPTRRGALDLRRAAAELGELAQRYGLAVDPWARVEHLSVGEKQRVEILKVLWRGCDVLILDEPTAVLTPAEVRDLFAVLRAVVAQGGTVVIITHKLDEVAALADAVTVMRRGAVVATLGGAAATPEALARAMVGRPVLGRVDKRPAAPAEPVLEVHGLHARGPGGTPMVRGVSFLVHAGEIVGIAGVVGNGQSELLEVIAGLRPAEAGRVVLGGQEITGKSPRERQARGMGHIPEDRHARGLLLPLPLTDNVLLGRVAEFSSPLAVHRDALAKFTRSLIEEFDVHPADPDYPAAALSGGNQQKLIVGRELTRPRPVLLLCGQPTRGVDIGAIELIHRQIVSARDRGLGILLFSTELEELRALADRVLVMYKGRIVASLRGEELHSAEGLERVGGLMTGAIAGEVAA